MWMRAAIADLVEAVAAEAQDPGRALLRRRGELLSRLLGEALPVVAGLPEARRMEWAIAAELDAMIARHAGACPAAA